MRRSLRGAEAAARLSVPSAASNAVGSFFSYCATTIRSEVMLEMGMFVKFCLLAECTGISFVDSTPLRVCKNQRIHIHKTFAGYA